jgi:hypothetical protein
MFATQFLQQLFHVGSSFLDDLGYLFNLDGRMLLVLFQSVFYTLGCFLNHARYSIVRIRAFPYDRLAIPVVFEGGLMR